MDSKFNQWFRGHALISPQNALKTKLSQVCSQQFKLQILCLLCYSSWKLCQQYSFYSFQSLGSSNDRKVQSA